MDMRQGLLCELTNAKADFDEKCENFDVDQKMLEKQMQEQREQQETEISESPNMKGSNWFLWIGILSIANIFLEQFGVHMIFGLGTTSILSAFGFVGVLLAILVSLSYIITYLFSAKEECEWAYRLGYWAYLADTIILFVCLFVDSSVIIDVVLHVILLISLYCQHPFFSQGIREKSKSETWSGARIIMNLVIGAFIIATIGLSVRLLNNITTTPLKQLESYVEKCNSEAKVDKSANQYLIGYELKDNVAIVKLHSNIYKNTEISSVYTDLMPIFSKELLMFYPNEFDTTLAQHCAETNYGMAIEWYDSNDEYTYTFSFSPTEVSKLVSKTPYGTSKKVWEKFLIAWNKQFPIPYIQDDLTYTLAEVNGNKAIINLVFQGWSASDLQAITNTYLKEYLIDIFDDLTDQYITLAKLNKMDICYRFTSDASLFWQEDVIFTPEEYINK
jgi:hypothetical protein